MRMRQSPKKSGRQPAMTAAPALPGSSGARTLAHAVRGCASEDDLRAVLDDAAWIRAVEATERAWVVHVVIRNCQVRVVPGVEQLDADLELQTLCDHRVLEEREVCVPDRGAAEGVASEVAELDGLAGGVRHGRYPDRGREGRGVEEAVNGAAGERG